MVEGRERDGGGPSGGAGAGRRLAACRRDAVAGGRGRGRGSGRGRGGGRSARFPGTIRKYDKYCPNRGVNLQCNGGTGCICNPKTVNTEATYEDPRGGCNRNWDKYGGICGPDNQFYATEADYYATLN